MKNKWFTEARYGLFIHYGLYSLLERGEWVWNREEIPRDEYKALAARFTGEQFDADFLCRMALDAGMRYVIFTTMHHEGFRLYPTALSDFHTGNSGAAGRFGGRDHYRGPQARPKSWTLPQPKQLVRLARLRGGTRKLCRL